jgi:DMSO/TMAO reductase YedYZ molybdopterin-dependent catalytic subunit
MKKAASSDPRGAGVLPPREHPTISRRGWLRRRTGVPLAVVLAEAGVKPQARWVLAEGADAAGMTRSIPLEKALDDALLVYAQNGEKLRPEQGYPLRLLLPGFEGNMSVKWLRRLKLGDRPFYTREETSKYTDLMSDGTARRFSFVMEAKSVIASSTTRAPTCPDMHQCQSSDPDPGPGSRGYFPSALRRHSSHGRRSVWSRDASARFASSGSRYLTLPPSDSACA